MKLILQFSYYTFMNRTMFKSCTVRDTSNYAHPIATKEMIDNPIDRRLSILDVSARFTTASRPCSAGFNVPQRDKHALAPFSYAQCRATLENSIYIRQLQQDKSSDYKDPPAITARPENPGRADCRADRYDIKYRSISLHNPKLRLRVTRHLGGSQRAAGRKGDRRKYPFLPRQLYKRNIPSGKPINEIVKRARSHEKSASCLQLESLPLFIQQVCGRRMKRELPELCQ